MVVIDSWRPPTSHWDTQRTIEQARRCAVSWNFGHTLTITPDKLTHLIDEELSSVSDARVAEHVRSLLVAPRKTLRRWDYGEPGLHYECWDVLEERGGLGITYSEHGFGPAKPWGLIRVSGTESEMSMGMDASWCRRFLDAYFESAASELPIWRVFKQREDDEFPGEAVGPELAWDSVWKEVEKLRELQDGARYNVHHSVGYSQGDEQ